MCHLQYLVSSLEGSAASSGAAREHLLDEDALQLFPIAQPLDQCTSTHYTDAQRLVWLLPHIHPAHTYGHNCMTKVLYSSNNKERYTQELTK